MLLTNLASRRERQAARPRGKEPVMTLPSKDSGIGFRGRALFAAGVLGLTLLGSMARGQEAEADPKAPARDAVPLPDRWRLDLPDWDRRVRGRLSDPYNLNPLKGDVPIKGTQSTFFALTAVSDTSVEARRLPVPSDVASADPDSSEFFGRGEQLSFVQEILLTLDLFHGSTSYKPVDWELRVTAAGNLNVLKTRENGIVNVDPSRGTDRTDRHFALQEAFSEVKLLDVSPSYDIVSLRAGIQGFTSDFRGFVFSDNNLGARLFGNFASNRYQWNVAFFDQLEKDTNSGLNTFERKRQQVAMANFYAQDFLWPGYTAQLSFHWNRDRGEAHLDNNGFPVRPALIGTPRAHRQDAYYFGWAGDGHIGRVNLSHAFYHVGGEDSFDPIAGREVRLNAQMAALELSMDFDWLRYKVSGLYQSGDSNPRDDRARGFDGILENMSFAGGSFSFWNRQSVRLTQTGVGINQRFSLYNNFKSSKDEGQSEYVNPGLLLLNAGLVAKLTPKLVLDLNANYLRFTTTRPIEYVLFQPGIPNDIGVDVNLGLRYRPFLNDNVIAVLGASVLFPGSGLKEIFSSNCAAAGCGADAKTLYAGFATLTFTY